MSLRMAGQPPPRLTQALNKQFRRWPLLFPLALVIVGGLLTALPLVAHRATLYRALIIGLVLLIVGLGMLPFGIVTAVKRRRNVIVLRCPHCHMTSENSARPFSVERQSYLDYAYIVCSNCGADFTLDKYARLR